MLMEMWSHVQIDDNKLNMVKEIYIYTYTNAFNMFLFIYIYIYQLYISCSSKYWVYLLVDWSQSVGRGKGWCCRRQKIRPIGCLYVFFKECIQRHFSTSGEANQQRAFCA